MCEDSQSGISIVSSIHRRTRPEQEVLLAVRVIRGRGACDERSGRDVGGAEGGCGVDVGVAVEGPETVVFVAG